MLIKRALTYIDGYRMKLNVRNRREKTVVQLISKVLIQKMQIYKKKTSFKLKNVFLVTGQIPMDNILRIRRWSIFFKWTLIYQYSLQPLHKHNFINVISRSLLSLPEDELVHAVLRYRNPYCSTDNLNLIPEN